MKSVRQGLGVVALAMALIGTGCTHHHYYGASPMGTAQVMPPGGVATAPVAVVAGNYCDVPGVVGTPAVVQTNPGRANTVISSTRPPTIITSQPAGGSGGWRNKRDPGGATTRMTGTLDSDTIAR